MTIPDDTIRRAAEAAPEWVNPNPCEISVDIDDAEEIIRAALPILRDAIRAELVQEMIADDGHPYSFAVCCDEFGCEDNSDDLFEWLRTYLPESETQP